MEKALFYVWNVGRIIGPIGPTGPYQWVGFGMGVLRVGPFTQLTS